MGLKAKRIPRLFLESDMQDEGGYLQNLTLYTSQSGVSTVALKRSADLDAEFGGKVYVAEYGSNMDSASFWITADLAGNAPEGSVLQLETTGLDGENRCGNVKKRIHRWYPLQYSCLRFLQPEKMAPKEHFILSPQEQKGTSRFTRSW